MAEGVSKLEYNYAKYNSLRAKSTNDPNSVLLKNYLRLERELSTLDPDDEAYARIDDTLRQYKYAIACVDMTEEISNMLYFTNTNNLDFRKLRSLFKDIRKNVIYTKKGGRFRRGNNRPPTNYWVYR